MSFWANVVGVTFTVEVAFGAVWTTASPSWTNVTSDVRSISINRGRSDEFGEIGPGTATVVLDNRGRKYDPEYSSGAYFGNLDPMTPIRIRANSVDLYQGFITGWPQRYLYPREAAVTATCVDATRYLESSILPGSAYEVEVLADSPSAYWPAQSTENSQSLVDVVAGKLLTLRQRWTNLSPYGMQLQNAAVSDAGFPLGASGALSVPSPGPTSSYRVVSSYATSDVSSLSAPKAIEFWWKPAGNTADTAPGTVHSWLAWKNSTNYLSVSFGGDSPYNGTEMTVRYGNSTDAKYLNLTTTGVKIDPDAMDHYVVYADTSNLYVMINGRRVWSTALSAGTPPTVTDGDTTYIEIVFDSDANGGDDAKANHFAWYGTAPSETRFQQHYLAGLTAWGHPYAERTGTRISRILDDADWPSGLRDLSTGDTPHGPYLPASQSALAYMRTHNEAERGFLFVDKSGNVAFRDRNWRWTSITSGGDPLYLVTEAGDRLVTEADEPLTTEGGGELTFSDATGVKFADVVIDANTVEALRNSVQITWADGTYAKTDTTSIAAYGPASIAVSTPTQESRALVEGLAAFILRTQKDPATRITQLTIRVRRDTTTLVPIVSAFEIGNRITVTFTPQNVGSALSKTLNIQGVQHDIGTDEWVTTLYLSPAWSTYTEAPYLRLGDATYGQIGATPNNKIPY